MVVAGTLNLRAAANLFIFPSFTALTAARRASEEYFVVVFRLYERTMMHKRATGKHGNVGTETGTGTGTETGKHGNSLSDRARRCQRV